MYVCHCDLCPPDDPNITVADFCAENSCYSQTSCDTCTTGDCLWCPSLSQCIPGSNLYGVAYPYGQCLGWVRSCTQLDCEERGNCTSCQELPQCGWCNDPSDTGKGQCSLGGFRGPRNENLCQSIDSVGNQEEWEFSQCSGECGDVCCVGGDVSMFVSPQPASVMAIAPVLTTQVCASNVWMTLLGITVNPAHPASMEPP